MSAIATTLRDTRSSLRADRVETTSRERGVMWWLWYGVSAGILAIILGIGVLAIALPRFTGAVPLTVLSSSMEPSLPPGTMLIVTPLAQDEMHLIRVGDVISYLPNPNDPTLVTHRVTGITSLSDGSLVFTTKGDALESFDAPVHDYQVRAKLWYSLPWIGWVANGINTDANRAWIIPTAAGLLFAYSGYTVIDAGVKSAKRRRENQAAQDLVPVRGVAGPTRSSGGTPAG
jgi:signal peptidase